MHEKFIQNIFDIKSRDIKGPVLWREELEYCPSYYLLKLGKLKKRKLNFYHHSLSFQFHPHNWIINYCNIGLSKVYYPGGGGGGCSVSKLYLTVCDPMNCSTRGFPVLHHLLEFTQIHVHWVSDAIQPSHPLLPSSLLLPSIFPRKRVFSDELALQKKRWPKELQLQH